MSIRTALYFLQHAATGAHVCRAKDPPPSDRLYLAASVPGRSGRASHAFVPIEWVSARLVFYCLGEYSLDTRIIPCSDEQRILPPEWRDLNLDGTVLQLCRGLTFRRVSPVTALRWINLSAVCEAEGRANRADRIRNIAGEHVKLFQATEREVVVVVRPDDALELQGAGAQTIQEVLPWSVWASDSFSWSIMRVPIGWRIGNDLLPFGPLGRKVWYLNFDWIPHID